MGSDSTLRVEARLIAKTPTLPDPEVAWLQEEAAKRGFRVEPIDKPQSPVDTVKAYLLERRRDFAGYFIMVAPDANSTESVIYLEGVGESGKCYYLAQDLAVLARDMDAIGLVLDGVFYREGPEIGELERVRVSNGKVGIADKAKLVFDDGEVYK